MSPRLLSVATRWVPVESDATAVHVWFDESGVVVDAGVRLTQGLVGPDPLPEPLPLPELLLPVLVPLLVRVAVPLAVRVEVPVPVPVPLPVPVPVPVPVLMPASPVSPVELPQAAKTTQAAAHTNEGRTLGRALMGGISDAKARLA
jgi:hypothetical protein